MKSEETDVSECFLDLNLWQHTFLAFYDAKKKQKNIGAKLSEQFKAIVSSFFYFKTMTF